MAGERILTLGQIDGLDTLKNTLKDIPLNALSYERNPATCEFGWHAPRGHSFKVEGKFQIEQRTHVKTGSGNYQAPIPSMDIFIDEYVGKYKDEYEDEYSQFLKRSRGDSIKADRLFARFIEKEELSLPGCGPEYFLGKWLIVEPDIYNLPDLLKKSGENILIEFKVAMDAEVIFSNEFTNTVETPGGRGQVVGTAFKIPDVIDWSQLSVEIGKECNISYIRKNDKKATIEVAKLNKTISKPDWSVTIPQHHEDESDHGYPKF